MSKRKQALRSLSANECGAVSAQPTEPIRAHPREQKTKFFEFESLFMKNYVPFDTFELLITL